MAADKQASPTSERLDFYARLRFMRLEQPKAFDSGGLPRWEATFILDPSDAKGQAGIDLILKAAAKIGKETYGTVPLAIKKLAAKFVAGAPKVDLNDPKNADDNIKIAFLDGDTKSEYAGYAGMFIVPAHNSKLRPSVANRKGLAVQPGEPQYPYDGAYGIGRITLWAQVGQTLKLYGKRIGVNLRGVQFANDGAPFTQDTADEDFTPLAEDAVETTSSSDFD